jgi:hypothetical protein
MMPKSLVVSKVFFENSSIKYWKIFEPIKENPQIDWPRKEKRDAQPALQGTAHRPHRL